MKFSIFTLASILATATAEDIILPWTVQAYADEVADVGDTITFEFTQGHNVFIHPTGTCDPTGAILVAESGPAAYTFSEEDAGESLFFTCQVGSHCELDQHVTVSVQEADESVGPEGPGEPAPPEGAEVTVPPEGTEAPVPPEGPEEPLGPEGTEAPVPPEGTETSAPPEGTDAPIPPEGPEEPFVPEDPETEDPGMTEGPAGADTLAPTADEGVDGDDWDMDINSTDTNTTDSGDDEDEDDGFPNFFGDDEDGATSLQLGMVGALATLALAVL